MNTDERKGGHRPAPERLKRLDRLFTRHPLYFVTTNTEDRKPLLANARIHGDFRSFCEAGLTRSVFVGKYVLMPDHLHLFVVFGEEYEAGLMERRRSQTAATDERRLQSVAAGGVRRSQTAATDGRWLQSDATGGIRRSQTAATDGQRLQSVATGEDLGAVGDRRISPLSEWMKSLKNFLSKSLRGMNIPAPHWQKGFFDHALRSEESYSEKWLYVAENPVRKQLVAKPEDWPYQGEIYLLQAGGRV